MFRLGVVSFLNSRPLIEGLETRGDVELTFDVPAALPARLERGELDAALIPTVDLLRSNGRFRVVSDACIGCDGPTLTVRVFSQVPPDRIRTLWVDADSHTSMALARILWREQYVRDLKLRRFDPGTQSLEQLEAVLLIGDKVVDPRRGVFAYEVDLGGAWREHTGLPFVFAVWATLTPPPSSGDKVQSDKVTGGHGAQPLPTLSPYHLKREGSQVLADLAVMLSAARDRGVARAAEIAERDGPRLGWPVELARRYLTQYLRYTLDARGVEGIRRFARYCAAAGLIPSLGEISWPPSLRSQIAGVRP
jgi:chorismate dehydratase